MIDEEKAYITNVFRCQKIYQPTSHNFSDENEIKSHILKIIQTYIPNAKTILDAGAGGGNLVNLLSNSLPNCNIIGIDPVYFSNLIVKGDIYNLPYTDNYFDIVIAKEVLQHINHISLAFREVKRVLNINGIFIIIDRCPLSFLGLRKPIYEKINKWMYPPDSPFYEKWYFAWEWRNLLKNFGDIIYFKIQNNKLGRKIFLNRDNRFYIIGIKNDK